jgi:hypothetical protein
VPSNWAAIANPAKGSTDPASTFVTADPAQRAPSFAPSSRKPAGIVACTTQTGNP